MRMKERRKIAEIGNREPAKISRENENEACHHNHNYEYYSINAVILVRKYIMSVGLFKIDLFCHNCMHAISATL